MKTPIFETSSGTVLFDAVGPNSSGATGSGVSSLSWTHTPVGNPSAVAVAVGYWSNATAISSVTYGGVAMTLAVSQNASSGDKAAIYGLANPPAGAQTVQITWAAGGIFANAGSISVTGSDTTTCFSHADGQAAGTGTSAACTVTSAVGELVVDMCNGDNATAGVTITSSGTRRWGTAHVGSEEANAAATAPGAATVTMTETLSASKPWAIVAASFKSGSGALETLLETNSFVRADLYTYTLADGTVLRFTNADIDITFSGNTWSSTTVIHDTTQTKTLAHYKIGLDVDIWTVVVVPRAVHPITGATFPDTINAQPWIQAVMTGALDGALVRIDRAYAASWPVAPATWGKFTPTGVLTMFTGRVAEVVGDDLEATLTLRDMRELLQISLPRNFFQSPCRHVLFDVGCTLSALSFKRSSAALVGSTRNVILSALAPPTGPGSNTFVLGRLVMTSGANIGIQRLIRTWVSGAFTLIAPLPYIVNTGDTFDAYPGCDKTLLGSAGCTGFANTVNFGGQPFIPAPETAV